MSVNYRKTDPDDLIRGPNTKVTDLGEVCITHDKLQEDDILVSSYQIGAGVLAGKAGETMGVIFIRFDGTAKETCKVTIPLDMAAALAFELANYLDVVKSLSPTEGAEIDEGARKAQKFFDDKRQEFMDGYRSLLQMVEAHKRVRKERGENDQTN